MVQETAWPWSTTSCWVVTLLNGVKNNLGKATLMLIASEVSFVSYQPVRLQQGFCRVNSWLKLHGTVDIKHSKHIAISAALFFSVSQSHQSRIHFFMDIWQITVVYCSCISCQSFFGKNLLLESTRDIKYIIYK